MRNRVRVLRNDVALLETPGHGRVIGEEYEILLGDFTLRRFSTVPNMRDGWFGEIAGHMALDYAHAVADVLSLPRPSVEDSGRVLKLAEWI